MKMQKSIIIQAVFCVIFFSLYITAGVLFSETFLDNLPSFLFLFFILFLSQKGVLNYKHRYVMNYIIDHNLEKFFIVIAIIHIIVSVLCLFDIDDTGLVLLLIISIIKANGCVNAYIMCKTEYVETDNADDENQQ